MDFTVYSPMGTVLEVNIKKVTFETLKGFYTLLPKHVDFVSAIKAGIVRYEDENNQEKFIASHSGIIVKKGSKVTMSVQDAILSNSLEELNNDIIEEFKKSEERRKELNTAMARLEVGILRGFSQLKDVQNGGL